MLKLTDLDILYKNTFPKFSAWVLQNSGSKEDAHDVFQEVLEMLLIKSNMGKLDVNSSMEAYVFKACKYRWIDQLRKRKRRGEVVSLDEKLLGESISFQEDMMELEEERQKYEALNQSFAMLSDLCQRLLGLVKSGTKPKEIAEQLGLGGASTVNCRKFACMKSWKKHLASHRNSQTFTTLKSK